MHRTQFLIASCTPVLLDLGVSDVGAILKLQTYCNRFIDNLILNELLNLSRKCAVVMDDGAFIRIHTCSMDHTVNFACVDCDLLGSQDQLYKLENFGPEGWGSKPRKGGARKGGRPKISRFFPLSRPTFHSFFHSLGVFVELWPGFEAVDTTQTARLGFSGVILCEPRRPVGDPREPKRAIWMVSTTSNPGQNATRRPQRVKKE